MLAEDLGRDGVAVDLLAGGHLRQLLVVDIVVGGETSVTVFGGLLLVEPVLDEGGEALFIGFVQENVEDEGLEKGVDHFLDVGFIGHYIKLY